MKKVSILLFMLISYISMFCDLDYQLESEFGFGGIGGLSYSNGKIFTQTAYGYAIYEIQENGNLENISNVRFSPGMNTNYSFDKIAVYSGYMTLSKREDYGSYFTIYDTSIPNEHTILYHTQIDIDNMLSAELFEDFFIRKTGNHQYTIFDYDDFQPISYVDNISLIYNTKFNDQGAVLLDYSDNCYYYYVIEETGSLHKKYNLGQEERKVAIDGDRLFSYSTGDIMVYNITEDDSLVYTGSTFYNNGPFESLVYEDSKLIFTTSMSTFPMTTMLKMYGIDDENNFTLLDTEQLINNPNTSFIPGSSLILQNGSLYISLINRSFSQVNIVNNSFDMLDVNYIERGQSSYIGFVKENKFYTMCFGDYINLDSYSLENYSDVQQVENAFPEKSGYWYFKEFDKVVRFDEILGCFNFYDWESDELTLTDTYDLSGNIDNVNLDVHKWDGTQFIYRLGKSLISVVKENEELNESWLLDDYTGNQYVDNINYAIYGNYAYQYISSLGLKVYSFDQSEYQLVNSHTLPFINNFPSLFIKGNILTATKSMIIDLSADQEGLSMRYNLNQWNVNSGAIKYYDYLIYCGEEIIETDNGNYDIQNALPIYKLINNEPIRVGAITSEYRIYDFQILEGGSEDSFDLLLSHNNFFSIYSCQATPNGNLEITPVTLNANNYPNPFNPQTTISYDISKQGNVSVDIYNLKGQKVKSLLNETQEAGAHKIIWQGDNEDGKQVSSGNYFYKVKSGDKEIVKKMLLMK